MNKIKLFEQKQVRYEWDEEAGKWWFSVVDVIGILTEQPDYTKVRNYWKWLKNKLKEEGSEVVSITNQLKMTAPDGKMRLIDVADTEQILRLIQSVSSPKAEPFKMWLAKVGRERIDETIDPEPSIDRAIQLSRPHRTTILRRQKPPSSFKELMKKMGLPPPKPGHDYFEEIFGEKRRYSPPSQFFTRPASHNIYFHSTQKSKRADGGL